MANVRMDYPPHQRVQGLVVEITSAINSITELTRPVTQDDIDHGRQHMLAALEIVKRMLRDDITSPNQPTARVLALVP